MNCAETSTHLKTRLRTRSKAVESRFSRHPLSLQSRTSCCGRLQVGHSTEFFGIWAMQYQQNFFPGSGSTGCGSPRIKPSANIMPPAMRWEGRILRPPKARTNPSTQGKRRKWPRSRQKRSTHYTFGSKKIDYSG